jgi:alanine dehydrogenase
VPERQPCRRPPCLCRAPSRRKLISPQTVEAMKPGSVIVDVAIDQGSCAQNSRPTTHSNPTYVVDDVVHYSATNIPGAVAPIATFALS